MNLTVPCALLKLLAGSLRLSGSEELMVLKWSRTCKCETGKESL